MHFCSSFQIIRLRFINKDNVFIRNSNAILAHNMGKKNSKTHILVKNRKKLIKKFASSKLYSYIYRSILKYRTWIRAD